MDIEYSSRGGQGRNFSKFKNSNIIHLYQKCSIFHLDIEYSLNIQLSVKYIGYWIFHEYSLEGGKGEGSLSGKEGPQGTSYPPPLSFFKFKLQKKNQQKLIREVGATPLWGDRVQAPLPQLLVETFFFSFGYWILNIHQQGRRVLVWGKRVHQAPLPCPFEKLISNFKQI